jgi:hypothetical protein
MIRRAFERGRQGGTLLGGLRAASGRRSWPRRARRRSSLPGDIGHPDAFRAAIIDIDDVRSRQSQGNHPELRQSLKLLFPERHAEGSRGMCAKAPILHGHSKTTLDLFARFGTSVANAVKDENLSGSRRLSSPRRSPEKSEICMRGPHRRRTRLPLKCGPSIRNWLTSRLLAVGRGRSTAI